MAQYTVDGQYRSRSKTYAKRTAAVVGGYAGLQGLLVGTRRGRRIIARQAAFHRKSGSSALAAAQIRGLKKTAGFRRRVRGIIGPLASRFHGLRAAGGFARMLR